METNRLREFIVLAECESFRAASQKLFISQSTLSRHVAELEALTGHTLVIRQNPVSLTPSGAVFERYARRLVDLCDRFAEDLSLADNGSPCLIKAQRFPDDARLGKMLSFLQHALEETLVGARFEHVVPSTPSVVDAVASGEIDVGMVKVFTHLDDVLMPPAQGIERVFLASTRQPLVAFCSKTGCLRSRPRVGLRDLASASLLATSALSPVETGQSLAMLAGLVGEGLGGAPASRVLDASLEKAVTTVDDDTVLIAEASRAALLPDAVSEALSLKATGLGDYRSGICLVMRENWNRLAERLGAGRRPI